MRDILGAAIAAALALASPGPGAAGEGAQGRYHEATDEEMFVGAFNLTVEELRGMDVLTSAGEVAGEVKEVLLDRTGQPVALVVQVGAVLGMGGQEVVIGFREVRRDRAGLVSRASTQEQIEALPRWEN